MAEQSKISVEDGLYRSMSLLYFRITLLSSQAKADNLLLLNIAGNTLNHAQGLIGKDNPRAARLVNQARRLINQAGTRKVK